MQCVLIPLSLKHALAAMHASSENRSQFIDNAGFVGFPVYILLVLKLLTKMTMQFVNYSQTYYLHTRIVDETHRRHSKHNAPPKTHCILLLKII